MLIKKTTTMNTKLYDVHEDQRLKNSIKISVLVAEAVALPLKILLSPIR